MEKITRVLGWTGLIIGVIVMITAMGPGRWPFIGFIGMLPGFLFSSAYVLLSTKYQIQSKWINPGYAGMLLSSTPLILIIYFQFIK